MSEMFDMGRYGFYVWSSYALFGAMLAWDLLLPRWRERRLLRLHCGHSSPPPQL